MLLSIPDSSKFCSPRLSSDGHYISAISKDGSKIMSFDTSANKWSVLAEGVHFGYNEWSPDGKFVYARSFRDGATEIVRVGIKDRELEHLFSLKEKDMMSDPSMKTGPRDCLPEKTEAT
jgi:hypothetical protein